MAGEASFCHVFLSFKGETRNKFICYLHKALIADGFTAFMDTSDIPYGGELDFTIKEGIRNSMSAIIIFSQNYAYSKWCLDELVLILERKKTSRYFIIPILYEVKIEDIKHQLGNYGLALEKHRARHSDKVEKWREALVEVGNLRGVEVKGPEDKFIEETVKLFRERFAATFRDYPLPTQKSSVLEGSSSSRPECRLPTQKSSVLEGSSSSRPEPSTDKVILYTTSVKNGLDANALVKKILSGNFVFEERNCSEEPNYLRDLKELVGNDNVRFPTVIVNGKDLCGEEEVEGLYDFEDKQKLMSVLKYLYMSTKTLKGLEESLQGVMTTNTSNSMYRRY